MRARDLAMAWLAGLPLLVTGGAVAAPAPRFEYRGQALTPRQAQSIFEPALRSPADSAALSRSLADLVARLQDLGHLDARARASWDSAGGPALVVRADEGPGYRLRAIRLVAPSAQDSMRFAGALGLSVGDRASPRAVGDAVERSLRAVVDHGHPYAEFGVSGWDADSGGVGLRLSGALGPRVTVTRARIDGLRTTREGFAQKAMGRLAGLPYNRAASIAARDRLAQLGLFRSVTLEGLAGEGDWSLAQLVYKVEEPRYNRFEGVVGVQGEAGTVGLARLDLGNLGGTGRAVSMRWQSRGRGLADFGARYAEPLVLGTPLRLEASLDQQVQDTIYVRTRWGGRAGLARSGQERFEAGYEEERVVQAQGEVEEASMQNTVFALERATLDPPLSPRRGSRVRIEAAQVFKRERLRPGGRRTAQASAVEAHGEWSLPLAAASGAALEVTGAGRFSTQRVLPLFERYPVGGAASLRGHDEEAFRVDRYALSRLEWRWFLAEAQRVYLFWDHAWMATRLPLAAGGDRFEVLHRDGIGFGMRLEARGGLVGVDYGLEPGRAPLEGKIHLRLVSTF
jgi:outer membrane protein assembly factor BamA